MRAIAKSVCVLAFLAAAPAFAQTGTNPNLPPIAAGSPSAKPGDVAVGRIVAPVTVQPASIIDTGSIAGQALVWVITVFGGAVGTAATGLLVKLLQKAGIETTEAQRDKLQSMIVNGLNLGAAEAEKDLRGKGQVEIKNAAVASAVDYVKAHGADTLKALGVDPSSPEFEEAVRARIETALADANTPTHPALDAPAKA